ncbi:response regulator [Enterovibrio norvegicus]|uniref:response regulator n=1 Tax=Enterovibrio norvegicus TaxID=188144 RepID=UPI0035516BEB
MKGLVKNEPVIVLADEDLSHIDFYQQVLSENGFWLRSVATPEKLNTILEQHPVNILVLNMDFHFADGESLQQEIRKIRQIPTCTDTRILLTTNQFSAEQKQLAYRTGASDYMVYPIAPDELFLKMGMHLIAGARKGIPSALSRSFNVLAETNMSLYPLLATAASCAQMLKKTSLSNKQAVYVESLHRAMKRATVLSDNLQDFEELSTQFLTLENTPFDLDQLLESLRDYLLGEAESREVELLFNVPLDVPRSLVGDPDRMRRILLNLISEAILIGEGCPIVLSINADNLSEHSVTLRVSIQENIAEHDEPSDHLEELAERAMMAMSEVDESIHLLIASYLIDSMGGRVLMDDEESTTGIHFSLDMQVSSVASDKSFAVPVDLRELRILVVDDNPSSIAVHSAIITSLGFDCEAVSSVDEAFSAIEEGHLDLEGEPFDLVLLDWHMPGKKGYHLLDKLQADMPKDKIPLVIVISAFDKAHIEKEKGKGKINGYLHKPISASVMFDTIMDVMGQNLPKTHRRVLDAQNRLSGVSVNGAGRRILVVDDMPINQQIAQEILISNDFQVDIAQTGKEAVMKVCPAPELYDAILMDLEMPEMNGLEATRIIRETADPEHLPILAVTAHTMERDRQRCSDAGMNDHVAKPIEAESLLQKLAVHLGLAVTTTDLLVSEAEEEEDEYDYVDTEEGIKRVMGNDTLYFKLLSDFVHQARVQENMLYQHIESGQLKQAAEHAHTIAGSAGNLSVIALRKSAKQLQNVLMALGDHDAALSQFKRDVDNAIKEIGQILLKRGGTAIDPKRQGEVTQNNTGTMDNSEANAFMNRMMHFKNQVMAQDLMAIDTYYQLLVDYCDVAPKLKLIGDKLINLEYTEAMVALNAYLDEEMNGKPQVEMVGGANDKR